MNPQNSAKKQYIFKPFELMLKIMNLGESNVNTSNPLSKYFKKKILQTELFIRQIFQHKPDPKSLFFLRFFICNVLWLIDITNSQINMKISFCVSIHIQIASTLYNILRRWRCGLREVFLLFDAGTQTWLNWWIAFFFTAWIISMAIQRKQ